ncbi:MAG: carbohydrate ABC transporter substrate-binding protein [Ktedonobacteraceae bacterium]|nr:carbohydrate ABC transporter substrate-binding protein [Ktedonobacteraceae bacterium]
MAGLALFGLAGCTEPASSPPPTTSRQAPAALRMIFWGSATRNELTSKAIQLFEKSHNGVTITSQFTGFDVYWKQLDALITSGKTPDLIQMDMRYLANFVRKGQLLDLTQSIYNQTIDLSDYDPLLLGSSKANNTVYGVPMGGNYQCFFYDMTLLNRANVGPLPANMDWATFRAYTREISRAYGKSIFGTEDCSGNITTFEVWIRQRDRNKEVYNREGGLGFLVDDAAEWFDYWNTLRSEGACVPIEIQMQLKNLSAAPDQSSMIKGKAVFNTALSNMFDAYQKAAAHPLDLVPMPRGKEPGMYLKASMLMSIAATTRYPDIAASFISFINNNADAVKALSIERGIPGSALARSMLVPQLTVAQRKILDYVSTVPTLGLTRVKEVLDPPAAGQIEALLIQTSQDIGQGKMKPAEGAKTFYEQAQKILGK